MKLATLNDGSRDGQLVVVARDLSQAHHAQAIAGTLQQVLDDWNFHAPQLEDLYTTLNHGKARHAFAFDPRSCMAPLPRAYQWVAASAASVVSESAAAALIQGSSDAFLGPCDAATFAGAEGGISAQAMIAVIVGDVAMGTGADAALESIRLVMLANQWHLKAPDAGMTATAFSPVAVTPDELGAAWRGGRFHLAPVGRRNGQHFGQSDGASEPGPHCGQLIARIARSRRLGAGSIVGCDRTIHGDEAPAGSARAAASLRHGDRIEIEMPGPDGQNHFGTLDQRVVVVGADAAGVVAA
jgi:fumarylacetoacetate (FAA) hydrolase